jgi:hypothetical protein
MATINKDFTPRSTEHTPSTFGASGPNRRISKRSLESLGADLEAIDIYRVVPYIANFLFFFLFYFLFLHFYGIDVSLLCPSQACDHAIILRLHFQRVLNALIPFPIGLDACRY